jgi:preprotein translocase subunit YajC
MDANAITTIISTLGFPIACCMALFWYMITQRKLHREETEKLAQTIQNNTEAIITLAQLIRDKEVYNDDIK